MELDLLISQPEAASLLGVTPAAVSYMAKTRKLRKRSLQGVPSFFRLTEVIALKAEREASGKPKTGRPSGRALLERRAKERL